MSNFHALAMSKDVASHPHISESNGFLGCFRHTIYAPTGSKVESYSNYYNETDARKVKTLIECTDEQIDTNVKALADAYCIESANYRLDICVSHDCQFIALQLNHVADDVVTHLTPIRYFEGKLAQKVDSIF